SPDDLDAAIPPVRAYAGAWHLVLAVTSAARLADLNYDFDALKALMLRNDLTTLQLIWRESDMVFHARNPFPVGGVVEDPATGAAAAALGGYLRDDKRVLVPTTLTIRQGETMGRPSLLTVEIPTSGGIVVSGTAVTLE
ncbi:MAG: PhzF family phenazine biosynthesis protein, partial [Cyanobacteria bacterium P01_D01_bin.44]